MARSRTLFLPLQKKRELIRSSIYVRNCEVDVCQVAEKSLQKGKPNEITDDPRRDTRSDEGTSRDEPYEVRPSILSDHEVHDFINGQSPLLYATAIEFVHLASSSLCSTNPTYPVVGPTCSQVWWQMVFARETKKIWESSSEVTEKDGVSFRDLDYNHNLYQGSSAKTVASRLCAVMERGIQSGCQDEQEILNIRSIAF